jgi:hypothetical protein
MMITPLEHFDVVSPMQEEAFRSSVAMRSGGSLKRALHEAVMLKSRTPRY